MSNEKSEGQMPVKPLKVRPSIYAMYFPGLKEIAYKYGYNLCIHGSMERDFDLVAFPWAEEVGNHFEMADAFRAFLGGEFNSANNEGDLAAKRQHGRVTYIINICRRTPFTSETDQQAYLDIGVFPPPLTPEQFIIEYPQVVEKIRKEAFDEGVRTGIKWMDNIDSLNQKEI